MVLIIAAQLRYIFDTGKTIMYPVHMSNFFVGFEPTVFGFWFRHHNEYFDVIWTSKN